MIDGTALSDGWSTQPRVPGHAARTRCRRPSPPTPRDDARPHASATATRRRRSQRPSSATSLKRRRRQQGRSRCKQLSRRDDPRRFDPPRRPLRPPRDRRRHAHDRQRQDRHEPRRHGCRRAVATCASATAQINSPGDDAHLPEEFVRPRRAARDRRRHDRQLLHHRRLSRRQRCSTVRGVRFQRGDEKGGRTGRIKLGTESIGGFRRIAIANCVLRLQRWPA